MKKLSFPLLCILLLFSCHMDKDSSPDLFEYEESMAINKMEPPQNAKQKSPLESVGSTINDLRKSKIIKEGDVVIEVENISNAKMFLDSLVSNSGGYYEKEIFKNSTRRYSFDLVIRLPSENFDRLINSLKFEDGEILEKRINAKDVTEEYLDLEIRLKNNLAYLKRYNELLNKAVTIKEMIAIQEKIRTIEKLVDTNKGRMKYLDNRAQFSVLKIDLSQIPEPLVAEAGPTFIDELGGALENGFSGLLFFIIVLANLWPLLVIVLFIVLFVQYKIKKKASVKNILS